MLLLSPVRLFVTPWTAAHQASLSFTISQSLLKLMSIESMVPSKKTVKMVHIKKKKSSRKKTKLINLGSLNTVNPAFLCAIVSVFRDKAQDLHQFSQHLCSQCTELGL